MRIKPIKSILASVCLLLGFSALIYAASQQDDLEMNRRKSAYSEQLQSQLKHTLGEYYSPESFLVNVKTHLQRITEKVRQPVYPQPQEETRQLPGLPAPPSSSMPEQREYYNEQLLVSDRFRVDYLEVSVIVDQKLFNSQDITFVERVVRMNPDIDTARGDRVTVTPLAFPVSARTVEEITGEADKSFLESIPWYIYLVLGLLLVMLLTILLLQIASMRKARKKDYDIYDAYNNRAIRNRPSPGLKPGGMAGELPVSAGLPSNVQTQEDKEIFYELRQLMVTTMIGNPELSADIFHRWIDTDKDEGVYKLAAFFKATDPKLVEFLSEYMGSELTAKVEFAMNQIQDIDKDSLAELFKKFREEFQAEQSARLMRGESSSDNGDIFHFLKQLNPHQIYLLVKDEPAGIMAVVLAQLSPEAANEVIQNLSPEVQLRIPVEIGKLKKVPISSYRDIARKLSKKALELEKIKYVSTDGINVLVDMLENSSPENEEKLLESVAEHDIALADELRKVYITFDELKRLPDRILADVLRSFDRKIIVNALVSSKEDIKQKIISNLPPRVKLMVSEELDVAQNEVPVEDTYDARRQITRKFRELAKTGKLDFSKYIT